MADVKYRRLAELTDAEIAAVMAEVYGGRITRIERDPKDPTEMEVSIVSVWEDSGEIEDDFTLTETEFSTHDVLLQDEDQLKYRQLLFALGVHPLTINNPYIGKVGAKKGIRKERKK